MVDAGEGRDATYRPPHSAPPLRAASVHLCRGIAHGDVYAHNLMADEEGRATLCDYGAQGRGRGQGRGQWQAAGAGAGQGRGQWQGEGRGEGRVA